MESVWAMIGQIGTENFDTESMPVRRCLYIQRGLRANVQAERMVTLQHSGGGGDNLACSGLQLEFLRNAISGILVLAADR